jgi:hypothetical protein
MERAKEIDGAHIKTMPAPPPEKVPAAQLLPGATHRDEEPTFPVRPKRKIKIIPIAIGVLVLVAGIVLWIAQPWSRPLTNSASTPTNHRIQVAMMPKAKGDPYFISCQGAEQAAKRVKYRSLGIANDFDLQAE